MDTTDGLRSNGVKLHELFFEQLAGKRRHAAFEARETSHA
jgi:hypothetical protein